MNSLHDLVLQAWRYGEGRAESPLVTALQSRMLDYRAFLEKGVVPRAGGVDDQHELYVRSMIAILSGESEVLKLIRKRADSERDRS